MPTFADIKTIYTDGACSGNPGPGGWGSVIYFTDGSCHEIGGFVPQTTNNRMELQAAIAILELLQNKPLPQSIPLYTDSEYVKNGITKWLVGWKRKGWKTAKGKPVLNQDLWQQLDQLNDTSIDWRYIRAHAGHEGNERCDQIARAFSQKQTPQLQQITMAESETQNHSMPEPSEATIGASRISHLHDLIDTLEIADYIAKEGYLISSSELADLMSVHANAVTSRGDEWVWRNWLISRVRREGNQILWQLERLNS
ncbi:ribonuclease HI [Acaryochloris sp. IP29b_bin.137]|uniref:ribonuclease HI n=1 Tax=Acaryochloris sp. IP29b_bin.137 TaxID=2969217 RepID=UPI00260DE932|nr:ribonuclease HI [Acaryochloris sp. IP29b_bin.137]